MQERHDERDRARRQAEEALLEPPFPHSAAPPPRRLLANRPFAWLVASYGISQLGFWAFFLAILGQAGFEYQAGAFQLGILFSSFSISFLLLTAPLGQVCDRWSPKWVMALAALVGVASVIAAMAAHSMTWLYLAFALDGSWEPVGGRIVEARGTLAVEVVSNCGNAAVEVEGIRRNIIRILSLDANGSECAAIGRRDPMVADLQARYPGLPAGAVRLIA